ncbi:hypothetical protein HK405_010731 [Cladochytrium tenue]|nr:hypothetical protein HK405_010731 [Cladochytrium tenue]
MDVEHRTSPLFEESPSMEQFFCEPAEAWFREARNALRFSPLDQHPLKSCLSTRVPVEAPLVHVGTATLRLDLYRGVHYCYLELDPNRLPVPPLSVVLLPPVPALRRSNADGPDAAHPTPGLFTSSIVVSDVLVLPEGANYEDGLRSILSSWQDDVRDGYSIAGTATKPCSGDQDLPISSAEMLIEETMDEQQRILEMRRYIAWPIQIDDRAPYNGIQLAIHSMIFTDDMPQYLRSLLWAEQDNLFLSFLSDCLSETSLLKRPGSDTGTPSPKVDSCEWAVEPYDKEFWVNDIKLPNQDIHGRARQMAEIVAAAESPEGLNLLSSYGVETVTALLKEASEYLNDDITSAKHMINAADLDKLLTESQELFNENLALTRIDDVAKDVASLEDETERQRLQLRSWIIRRIMRAILIPELERQVDHRRYTMQETEHRSAIRRIALKEEVLEREDETFGYRQNLVQLKIRCSQPERENVSPWEAYNRTADVVCFSFTFDGPYTDLRSLIDEVRAEGDGFPKSRAHKRHRRLHLEFQAAPRSSGDFRSTFYAYDDDRPPTQGNGGGGGVRKLVYKRFHARSRLVGVSALRSCAAQAFCRASAALFNREMAAAEAHLRAAGVVPATVEVVNAFCFRYDDSNYADGAPPGGAGGEDDSGSEDDNSDDDGGGGGHGGTSGVLQTWYMAEERLSGFRKFTTSRGGRIDNTGTGDAGDDGFEFAAELAGAFSHWTLCASRGALVVTDAQGRWNAASRRLRLTDPALGIADPVLARRLRHHMDPNYGRRSVELFCGREQEEGRRVGHMCGRLCRALGLDPL